MKFVTWEVPKRHLLRYNGLQMLTYKTAQKTTRQMSTYGELQSGAFDYVPSKLAGHRDERHSSISSNTAQLGNPPIFARQWSEEKGAYVYIEL
jgi:hypothetical protein